MNYSTRASRLLASLAVMPLFLAANSASAGAPARPEILEAIPDATDSTLTILGNGFTDPGKVEFGEKDSVPGEHEDITDLCTVNSDTMITCTFLAGAYPLGGQDYKLTVSACAAETKWEKHKEGSHGEDFYKWGDDWGWHGDHAPVTLCTPDSHLVSFPAAAPTGTTLGITTKTSACSVQPGDTPRSITCTAECDSGTQLTGGSAKFTNVSGGTVNIGVITQDEGNPTFGTWMFTYSFEDDLDAGDTLAVTVYCLKATP